jgi:hypothetical protein
MNEHVQHFRQGEYNRVLDKYNAREKGLSYSECVNILIDAGASYEHKLKMERMFIFTIKTI